MCSKTQQLIFSASFRSLIQLIQSLIQILKNYSLSCIFVNRCVYMIEFLIGYSSIHKWKVKTDLISGQG